MYCESVLEPIAVLLGQVGISVQPLCLQVT